MLVVRLAVSLKHSSEEHSSEVLMDSIIYLIGLIVIVMAILSFFGLR